MSEEVFTKYAEANSSSGGKFWEVRVEGSDMHIRFGKVGQEKAWKTTSFKDHAAAVAEATKKFNGKVKKGYAEIARDGESSGPVKLSYEERFGEIRSLVEEKESASSVSAIKHHFEAMWAEDKERVEDEVVPFLRTKLENWRGSSFTQRVKQVGAEEKWSKAVAPLFDDAKIDDSPFSLFTRRFVMNFEGRYQPGDDVELSDYMERKWVRHIPSVDKLVASRAGRQLESVTLTYVEMCEMQQYSCPAHSGDLRLMLTNMPGLKEVTIQNSWAMHRFADVFSGDDVVARLRNLDLLKSPLAVGDLGKLAAAEQLGDLERLALDVQVYASRGDEDLTGELGALFASEHMSNLTELVLSNYSPRGGAGFDVTLARALAESTFAPNLTKLRLASCQLDDDALTVLLTHENLKKLKTLDLYGTLRPEHLDALEALPEKIGLKILFTNQFNWGWSDEQQQRLSDWCTSRKVKHKPMGMWTECADY